MTTLDPATTRDPATTFDPAQMGALTPAPGADLRSERDSRSARARRIRRVGQASWIVPVLGAVTGSWLALGSREHRAAGMSVLGASLGLGLVRWQLQRVVTEQVPYEVQATLGEIQLRSYPGQILAETLVRHAVWSEALREGFQRLADYIFGHNDPIEHIAAAEPAASAFPRPTPLRSGEKLAMTAPVLASIGKDGAEGDRHVAFFMPADRHLRDLPVPRDRRVRLRPVPERLVAALSFRGDYESDLPALMRERLLSELRAAGIAPRGEVMFAGYDPPSTLSMLRRNEVWVELEEA